MPTSVLMTIVLRFVSKNFNVFSGLDEKAALPLPIQNTFHVFGLEKPQFLGDLVMATLLAGLPTHRNPPLWVHTPAMETLRATRSVMFILNPQ